MTENKDKIKVNGHTGTFYVIDERIFNSKTLYLLESELFGDEAPCICVDEDINVIAEDIYNGLDEVEERIKEEY